MDTILKVNNLKKYFPLKTGVWKEASKEVRAVDGVSFSVRRGETLGLVGESGCGKSTLGRLIAGLYEPTEGDIIFEGENISQKKGLAWRKRLQVVFQDPFSSLNPRMNVESLLSEGINIHGLSKSRKEKNDKVRSLMELVGLDKDYLKRYPHEFSGGQRQRISLARSLSVEPEFLVADEPVSSLDVSIQAQIINLFRELQDKFSLTYLFISHDLRVIEFMCDRVAVMYLGKIVELAGNRELYGNPLHPYTQSLLSAIPRPFEGEKSAEKGGKRILKGDMPSAIDMPAGCRFRARCAFAAEICASKEPELNESAPGHLTACHLMNTGNK